MAVPAQIRDTGSSGGPVGKPRLLMGKSLTMPPAVRLLEGSRQQLIASIGSSLPTLVVSPKDKPEERRIIHSAPTPPPVLVSGETTSISNDRDKRLAEVMSRFTFRSL